MLLLYFHNCICKCVQHAYNVNCVCKWLVSCLFKPMVQILDEPNMTEEAKILKGELFCPGDPELKAMKRRSHDLSAQYSRTSEGDVELRARLAQEILAAFGEGSFMQGPVFFHYGKHTRIGLRNFINYNFTVQDDALVTIGNDNNFGPNVTIVTPCHPILPDERRAMLNENGEPKHLCYARPVTIGND